MRDKTIIAALIIAAAILLKGLLEPVVYEVVHAYVKAKKAQAYTPRQTRPNKRERPTVHCT